MNIKKINKKISAITSALLEQHSTNQIQGLELTIVTKLFCVSLFVQAFAPGLAKVMIASFLLHTCSKANQLCPSRLHLLWPAICFYYMDGLATSTNKTD